MNWSSQTKKFRLVINPPKGVDKDVVYEILKGYCECIAQGCEYNGYIYGGIIHHDEFNKKGELEIPHIHVNIVTSSRVRVGTIVNRVADFCGINNVEQISCMGFESLAAVMQYLVHKNNPEKKQYESSLIFTNISVCELEGMLSEEVVGEIDTAYLLYLIDEGRTNREIALEIGLGRYVMYRNAISDFRKSSKCKKIGGDNCD